MMKSQTSKLAFLMAFFLILLNVIFPVTAIAVSPWSGTPWEGDSWEGNPWEGHEWEGNEWNGQVWSGNEWEGQVGTGNAWENPSWNGQAGTGNPWGNPLWNGQVGTGNPWENPSWNGQASERGYIPPFADEGYFTIGAPDDVYGWNKFLINDIGKGVIDTFDSSDGFSNGALGFNLLESTLKMTTSQKNEAISGAFDAASVGKDTITGAQRFN